MPKSAVDGVLDLTRQLVAIDSVSASLSPGSPGEAEIAAFAADRLSRAGFVTEIIPAPSDPRRQSVLAVWRGSRPGRTVMLNGHLDTVGVEGMLDPFTARIDGDRLYGRGTSDMKGGVAGIIVAAEALAAAGVPGRIVVTLAADEEDDSLGALSLVTALADRAIEADVCLIAEPTWLDLPVAHRGFAVVDVAITGRAAHSSQPGEGIDVMPAMGALLVAVAERDAELRAAPPHPLLAHGSLMATVARAGTAPFTVPAEAEVLIERRTLPGETSSVALREVSDLIEGIRPSAPEVGWRAQPGTSRSAWQLDASGPAAELAALLEESLPAAGASAPACSGAPYWMESALWQEAGVPTLVCGPAGGGLHALDEWVDIPQLERFPVALVDAVGRFLAD